MTLGFMQRFPWKTNGEQELTNFREKILAGANYMEIVNKKPVRVSHDRHLITVKFNQPKLHTIRADPHNRWKPGRKIEMVYRGSGYRIIDHFNKNIPALQKCVSVQRIEIKWITEGSNKWMAIYIDGVFMNDKSSFASIPINDGFDGFNQFTKWFKKDFAGNLIHWTDLRY